MNRPLPIGIENFKELIGNEYYYVDKTLLIKELLDNRSKVSLFMRPRRFGKTLSLSMLRYYFEKAYDQDGKKTDDHGLFEGLKIMEAGECYIRHMGQYPVVSLSLKSSKQPDFEKAFIMIKRQIADEFRRHQYVLEKIAGSDHDRYLAIMSETGEDTEYLDAIAFLSRILKEVSGRPAIILLDEYDVPLENAYFRGFYGQMTDFIRSLFESALKTNPNLEFAVVTGCLQISKESIFTGLNNLEIISILNRNYAEHFGFTQPEVERLLEDYGIFRKREEVKRWYDGYLFGDTEVYNPWSVLNYVKAAGKGAFPKPYWANTSSNGIIRELIGRADTGVRQEIETLIAGGTIEKPVHEEITYEEVYRTKDNLWNFLFFTGYLKKVGERLENRTVYIKMAIPNEEVTGIYEDTILAWLDERNGEKKDSKLIGALLEKDTAALEKQISMNLMETISFYDYREAYYHGFLGGLLKSNSGYTVKSNRESGLGRSDLLLLSAPYDGIAVIIEIKVADTLAELDRAAEKALEQMEERQYDAELRLEGYHTFILYGIAFYKKLCKVMVGK